MIKFKEIVKRIFSSKKVPKQITTSSVEELISELEEVQLKKQRIAHYMEELAIREEAHKQYENLDSEAVSKINVLAQKAKDIEEKKNNLKGRLISNNAALNRLSKYENDLPNLIKEMHVAEKRRRETESHIMYLQEEREYLEEDRESLLMGYHFLKWFSVSMMIIIGVCLLVSFIMLQVLREKIWFILSGVVVVTMVFVISLILTKERLEKEIKDNGILQQKAVRFLNKSKIRFFNQTQYLEFQYQKLGVDSVAKLELYYNRYLKNKNNEKIYLQMNDKLTDIEEEILSILHQKDILLEDIGDLADWILKPKRLNDMKMLEEDRQKTQEQLLALETYEKELWSEIYGVSEDEEMKKHVEEKLADYNGENLLDKMNSGA